MEITHATKATFILHNKHQFVLFFTFEKELIDHLLNIFSEVSDFNVERFCQFVMKNPLLHQDKYFVASENVFKMLCKTKGIDYIEIDENSN